MWKDVDFETIFVAARKKGFQSCEIYAERAYHTRIRIQNRLEDVRLGSSGGVSLRLFDGKSSRHLSTPHLDPRALVRLIEGKFVPPAPPEEEPFSSLALGARSTAEAARLVASIARASFSDESSIRFPALSYDDTVRFFLVASSNGGLNQGREEEAECAAHWGVERGGRHESHVEERARASVTDLLAELRAENPFPAAIRHSLALANPWPSPRGEIPVRWSARALSKLCLQFARAFEGDLVLRERSFLNSLPFPLDLPFTLEDAPDPASHPCDHDGSPTRTVTFFHEGQPQALALNNRTAHLLNLPSTGHCRRQSYQAPPTIGLWRPRLRPREALADSSLVLDWGLSVSDLSVLRFDPSSGAIELRLQEVRLLHHGEEGEIVEPIELKTNLLELMQRLRGFEQEARVTGLPLSKQHQRFLTEVCAPAAVSDPLEIPGSVPLNHYW